MTVTPAHRGRRLVATALAKAESWLLEPVEAVERPASIRLRPVIAVVALAPRVGTTTLARALGVELAVRDPLGAAAVTGTVRPGTLGIAGASSGRLARALGTAGGQRLRSLGRLCVVDGGDEAALADAVRPLAPLVLDVPHGRPAGVPLALADHVVLVASTDVEPALAAVAAASMARVGPPPLVAVNRDLGEPGEAADRWASRADLVIAESRAGARLALSGRDHRGALGSDLERLAETCEQLRSDW